MYHVAPMSKAAMPQVIRSGLQAHCIPFCSDIQASSYTTSLYAG
jgi:hypothetical protein